MPWPVFASSECARDVSIMLHCCGSLSTDLEHPFGQKAWCSFPGIFFHLVAAAALKQPLSQCLTRFLVFHCSGMGASAIGLSHVAVQFPVYEFLKRWLGERRQKERGEASMADRLSTADLILASSTSKVIGFGFPNVPPAPLPAYQHAVCASVATVTPPSMLLLVPFWCVTCFSLVVCVCWVVQHSPNWLLRHLQVCCILCYHCIPMPTSVTWFLCCTTCCLAAVKFFDLACTNPWHTVVCCMLFGPRDSLCFWFNVCLFVLFAFVSPRCCCTQQSHVSFAKYQYTSFSLAVYICFTNTFPWTLVCLGRCPSNFCAE